MPMISVGRMMQSLQQRTDAFDYGMAVAYIRGIDAGMWISENCYIGLGAVETNEDLALWWVDFALDHPDVWYNQGAVIGLTYGMLKKRYPCEEKDGQGSGDPETPAPTE
jgi:hypothetical protein